VVRIQAAPTGSSLAKAATAASALDKRGHSAAAGIFFYFHIFIIKIQKINPTY
jgi:hypothetical protein